MLILGGSIDNKQLNGALFRHSLSMLPLKVRHLVSMGGSVLSCFTKLCMLSFSTRM